MSFSIIQTTLAAAVADAGTFTVSYPSGKDEGNFFGAHGHKIAISGGSVLNFPEDFGVTLGTANITITNKTGGTLAAGLELRIQIEEQGKRAFRDSGSSERGTGQLLNDVTEAPTFLINLGAPDVADVDGICAAQAVAGAGDLTINGALATGGVATFDVARGIQTVSANAGDTTQTLTFTGTDEYGNAIVETISLNGTTIVFGKKAFKTITQVTASAATAGNITAGSSDILGLPVFLPGSGHVLKEMEDGVAATAGTFVAGDLTAGGATATTGDVRGTYDPNSAADGDKVFQLIAALPDPGYIGVTQYAG